MRPPVYGERKSGSALAYGRDGTYRGDLAMANIRWTDETVRPPAGDRLNP
ncbi:MAG: hypothetical protein QOI51_2008 [Nocardioidaceae bacterium]|jgi:hypothetical protein|nr:hypothetical protein [Nocardioidaceae bacterium]